MEFPDPEVNAYAERFTEPESQLLSTIHRETWSEVLMPRMLSGHMQGRILSMIAQMLQPKRILEVGTYTGYSALCMAEGLTPDGRLHTIDVNDELEGRIRSYFAASEYDSKIELHIGHALDIIQTLDEHWDLVFIDADKENYAAYYDAVIERMQAGGWIVADNVLWTGKVLDPEEGMDAETLALHTYNDKIMNDDRVASVLLPVRDGLMCCRKL